jgi:hypothetical protein
MGGPVQRQRAREPGRGANAYDTPVPAGAQVRPGVFAGEEHDIQLVAQREIPVLVRLFVYGIEADGARVVVQGVDPAVCVGGPVDLGLHGTLVLQIERLGAGHGAARSGDPRHGLSCPPLP